MLRRNGLILLLTIALGCSACAPSIVQIGTIRANPSYYLDQLVDIQGRVTSIADVSTLQRLISLHPMVRAWGVSSLPSAAYELDDATGSIIVITNRPAPPLGKELRVRARVSAIVIVDEWSPGLHAWEHTRWRLEAGVVPSSSYQISRVDSGLTP